MPEMQEQFPAMAMEGRYAGNAGAISGSQLRQVNNRGFIFCGAT
jgi:hypothetical protein